MPPSTPPTTRHVFTRAPRARAWARNVLGWLVLALVLLAAGSPPAAAQAGALAETATRLGPGARDALVPLVALLDALQQGSDSARLEQANRFFNERIVFGEDRVVWGQADYWASPMEALSRGVGDCEDFAIAKYVTLASTGTDPSRLRLVYTLARTGAAGEPPGGQAHMVLVYHEHPGADPLVLDNLVPDILPMTQRPDLLPVFSFNAEGLWLGVGQVRAGDPLARLSRWRGVLVKAREEGFLWPTDLAPEEEWHVAALAGGTAGRALAVAPPSAEAAPVPEPAALAVPSAPAPVQPRR